MDVLNRARAFLCEAEEPWDVTDTGSLGKLHRVKRKFRAARRNLARTRALGRIEKKAHKATLKAERKLWRSGKYNPATMSHDQYRKFRHKRAELASKAVAKT